MDLKILSVLPVFLLFLASTEAKKLKCEPIICPVCDFRPTDTYADFALREFGRAPPDGGCLSGQQKYVHMGRDFNMTHNACCCLELPPTDPQAIPVVCDAVAPAVNSPACVDNLKIGIDEKVSHYYARIGRDQANASADGCCPNPRTFKYIYKKEYTGTEHDVCTCVIVNGGFTTDTDDIDC